MKHSNANLSSLALVVLSFGLTAAMYSRLPELVPVHWNARGEVNGFFPKPWGPFLLPLAMVGVYLLLLAVPRISPRGYRVERFQRVFEITRAAILAFLFLVNVLVLLAGIGAPVPVHRAVYVATGLLFVFLGNFMGKFTKNFFVGIRTPWTLASDEVWLKTHRLSGKVFVLAGTGVVASGLLGGGPVWLLVAIAAACGIPVAYSYVLYRRIDGFKNGTHNQGTPNGSP